MNTPPPPAKRPLLVRPSVLATLKLAFPVVLLNLTYVSIQVTDAWIAGRLGFRELAALTPPSMLLFVIISGAYAALSVITAFVSQALGRNKLEECGRNAWLGIYIAGAAGALSLLLMPGAALFEILAGEDEAMLGNLEARYFRISLLSMTPILITTSIANFYFGIRKPGVVLLASLVGFLSNIVFSFGLAFGVFGLPAWGFDGIAWGSVFATTAELLLLGSLFVFAPSNRKYNTATPPRSFQGLRSMLAIGWPAGVQGAVDVLTWGVLLSALVSVYGTTELAAATILLRCMQLTFLPAEGVATVAISLVANSIGCGRPIAAREHARIAFRINSVFMVSAGILFYALRIPIAGLFTDDPEVIRSVGRLMGFVAAAQWFDAMSLTFLHALLGTGDTHWSNRINIILSLVILGIGGGVAVLFFRDAGVAVIWFLAWLYIAAQGLAFWWRWRSMRWRDNRLEDCPGAA